MKGRVSIRARGVKTKTHGKARDDDNRTEYLFTPEVVLGGHVRNDCRGEERPPREVVLVQRGRAHHAFPACEDSAYTPLDYGFDTFQLALRNDGAHHRLGIEG